MPGILSPLATLLANKDFDESLMVRFKQFDGKLPKLPPQERGGGYKQAAREEKAKQVPPHMTPKKSPDHAIDILQHEIDNDLKHWLSPEEKMKGKREEIRKKHRDAWLAKQKEQRKQKAKPPTPESNAAATPTSGPTHGQSTADWLKSLGAKVSDRNGGSFVIGGVRKPKK